MRGLWVCEIIMHYKKTQCLYGSFNASSSQNTVQTFKVYQSNSVYVWSDRKSSTPVWQHIYADDGFEICIWTRWNVTGCVWNAWHCASGWIFLWRSAQWQNEGGRFAHRVKTWGESGGNRAEERKQQRRSREQVLLTWGGKGCRLGIPSSG